MYCHTISYEQFGQPLEQTFKPNPNRRKMVLKLAKCESLNVFPCVDVCLPLVLGDSRSRRRPNQEGRSSHGIMAMICMKLITVMDVVMGCVCGRGLMTRSFETKSTVALS